MKRFFQFRLLTLLILTAVVGAAVGVYIKLPTGTVEEVTAADFQQKVLASRGPVVVEFSAEWCVPCRKAKPMLDELAYEQRWQTKIFRVDIDESPKLASQYAVTAIPALVVFKDGRAAAKRIGFGEKSTFYEVLTEANDFQGK